MQAAIALTSTDALGAALSAGCSRLLPFARPMPAARVPFNVRSMVQVAAAPPRRPVAAVVWLNPDVRAASAGAAAAAGVYHRFQGFMPETNMGIGTATRRSSCRRPLT
jgi:hypothetical protein